jgi:hypothetical protein
VYLRRCGDNVVTECIETGFLTTGETGHIHKCAGITTVLLLMAVI